MTAIIINTLTFVAVFLAVYVVNSIILDVREGERRELKQRLDEQRKTIQRERLKKTRLSKDFSQIAAEAVAGANDDRQSWLDQLRSLIAQSGLDVSIRQILLYSGICAALVNGIAWSISGDVGIAAGCGMVAAFLPVVYLRQKRSARIKKLRTQLPDTFELMARVMKSGQSIAQAMKAVADEFDEPVSLEFLYCYEQMNLGLPQDVAMRELARRTGILEIKIFVLGVLVHRQTGGNLAELLENLSHVVRERFRIQGMISSLTAQGRLQAILLLSLPPGMFALLMVMKPSYEMMLFEFPWLIAAAVASMMIGWFWIQKIVRFDY